MKQKETRGAILVEMIIILPLLMTMLAGIFHVGRLIYFKLMMANAARIGVEAAIHVPPDEVLEFPFSATDFFGARRAHEAVMTYLSQRGVDTSRVRVGVYAFPYGFWNAPVARIPENRRRRNGKYTGVGSIHPFLYKLEDILDIALEDNNGIASPNAHERPAITVNMGGTVIEGEGPHNLDPQTNLRTDRFYTLNMGHDYELRSYGWMIGVRVEYDHQTSWMVRALLGAASALSGSGQVRPNIRLKAIAAMPVPMSFLEILATHQQFRSTLLDLSKWMR